MYRCSFPGCPTPVRIHISLIETLERIVSNQQGEWQGLLYGQTTNAGTIVESSQPVTSLGLPEMGQAVAAAHGTVVGCYRIRDGVTLELTPQEMSLAVSLFGKPRSVVLLIERRTGGPAANFFFSEHGAFLNVPLLQFPLNAIALGQEEAQRLSKLNARAISESSAGLPAPGSLAALPAGAKLEPSRRTGRPWVLVWMLGVIVLAAAASFSAALLIYRPPAKPAIRRAGGGSGLLAGSPLRAERQGDDLKILWDLHSPAVAEATSGLLDIVDGSASRRILMTADQVRFGSLLYSPETDQISVRLTTLKNDQSTEQESVLVLLKRRPPNEPVTGHEKPRVAFEVKTQPLPAAPSAPSGIAVPGSGPAVFRDFAPLPAPQVRTDAHVEVLAAPSVGAMAPMASANGSLPGDLLKPVLPAGLRIAAAPPAAQRASAAAGEADPTKPQAQEATTPDVVYVSPMLVAPQGVKMPPELRGLLKRPLTVKVHAEINAAGRVTQAEAIPGQGLHELLLRAATEAALQCRFQPARRGQTAVPSSVMIEFHVDPDR
ncbi:MAG TPA: energy transducer TonB [Bryobacteraceae bacterium]|nr:energy transducer TonB [Bryobacteraceae bacterium]